MSSYKAFVYFGGKAHEIIVTSLNLKSLKEEVVKIVNTNDYFRIVDNNEQEIINDQQLKISFEIQPALFFVYCINNNDNDEKKYPEDKNKKEDNECYKIVNPLVLLTGASKYNNLDYLPEVKADLIMIRNLFEEIYGYDVYSTYDQNKPETELLTLNQLEIFLMKHYINNNYDSLIFVWCGHGNTISEEGDILITSDDDNEYKLFKKVQELFTNIFLNKPKIFIKNIYQKNE
ncbi:hypothetical protein RFI_38650 [Reticulomyxa filosa]|uniref:Peptidase C14 caspase domain-containing protein n=1 Tax=Reticulomyxa filosa TaxID=46433 RepID=X6LCK0_RETFI|nr:hypothetical protein RFI_38650 [Reticulomyxa filosa]|eukprot:ETN98836.1 hypothetical protein RFI_38650 [Reticulomyxa filosa]